MKPGHLASALLLALPLLANAATYRWVDENGVTVYSQTPPPPNLQADTIAPPPPPADPDARDKLDALRQQLDIQREQRQQAAEEVAKAEKEQQRRAENCRRAKQNLTLIQQRSRQLMSTSDGGYERATPELKAEKIAEYQKVIDRDCGPPQPSTAP